MRHVYVCVHMYTCVCVCVCARGRVCCALLRHAPGDRLLHQQYNVNTINCKQQNSCLVSYPLMPEKHNYFSL